MATKAARQAKGRFGVVYKKRRKIPGLGSKEVVIAYLLGDTLNRMKPHEQAAAKARLRQFTRPQLEKLLEKKYQKGGRSVTFDFLQAGTPKSRHWKFRIWSSVYPQGYHYDLRKDWNFLYIWGPNLPMNASNEELAHAAGVLAKRFGFTKRDYPTRYMRVSRKGKGNNTSTPLVIMEHRRRNPGPGEVAPATAAAVKEKEKKDAPAVPPAAAAAANPMMTGRVGTQVWAESFSSGGGKTVHAKLVRIPDGRFDLHIHTTGQGLVAYGPMSATEAKRRVKALRRLTKRA